MKPSIKNQLLRIIEEAPVTVRMRTSANAITRRSAFYRLRSRMRRERHPLADKAYLLVVVRDGASLHFRLRGAT